MKKWFFITFGSVFAFCVITSRIALAVDLRSSKNWLTPEVISKWHWHNYLTSHHGFTAVFIIDGNAIWWQRILIFSAAMAILIAILTVLKPKKEGYN